MKLTIQFRIFIYLAGTILMINSIGLLRKMIFISALCLSTLCGAQDIHFSQFYMSPLNLNPAMTGVMNCTQRFVANYRNQWASVLKADAYTTYSVSYDQKLSAVRTPQW